MKVAIEFDPDDPRDAERAQRAIQRLRGLDAPDASPPSRRRAKVARSHGPKMPTKEEFDAAGADELEDARVDAYLVERGRKAG
jgi:hypothetical protein